MFIKNYQWTSVLPIGERAPNHLELYCYHERIPCQELCTAKRKQMRIPNLL